MQGQGNYAGSLLVNGAGRMRQRPDVTGSRRQEPASNEKDYKDFSLTLAREGTFFFNKHLPNVPGKEHHSY